MPIDTSPSTVATSALQAIPFGTLIGGPLDAAIQAQARAAKTTTDFINAVGFDADGKAKQVIFEYNREGKIVTMIVPLLVIVPIPYIQVDTIDINFKANISASASSVTEQSESTAASGEVNAEVAAGWGPFSVKASFKANYSSKKDSKATQDSRYSVEYTMDVAVHASQSSMPTGLATVLNILSGSIAGSERGGQVTVTPASQTMRQPQQQLVYTFNVKDQNGVNAAGVDVALEIGPVTNVTYKVAVGTEAPKDAPWVGKTDADGNITFTVSPASTVGLTAPATAVVSGTATLPVPGGGTGTNKKTVTAALTLDPAALPPAPHLSLAGTHQVIVVGEGGTQLASAKVPSTESPDAVIERAVGGSAGASGAASAEE
ncbi:MAG TPA: DUF2589 domain-containing protein [Dongiaceae bacterium]|nr:DUF2589 domain-containing protein [Dongiaceae bacterium]